MSTVFGESGPKHVEVLTHPTRRQSNTGPPPPPPPDDGGGPVPAVFGETGPKHVEVLDHPTRRQSNVGPPPVPSAEGKRMSLDSEMAAAEAGDHFEMMPAPSQLPPATRTWPAAKAAFSPQLSGGGGGVVRIYARYLRSICTFFCTPPRAWARRARRARRLGKPAAGLI